MRRYLKILNNYGYVNPILITYLSNDKFDNRKRDKFTPNIKILSDSTVIQIFKNLNSSTKKNKLRGSCVIKLLLYLGLRRDEVLNLQWKQINFISNEITIIRNKNSSINTVTIPKSLRCDLKTYYNICYTKNRGILPTYVFYGKNIDKPLSVASYNNLINIYTSNLNDVDGNLITGHTFRHTFITNCIKNNAPLADIQMYTGLDIKTLQYYTHLTANYNSKVAEILDTLYITEKTAC